MLAYRRQQLLQQQQMLQQHHQHQQRYTLAGRGLHGVQYGGAGGTMQPSSLIGPGPGPAQQSAWHGHHQGMQASRPLAGTVLSGGQDLPRGAAALGDARFTTAGRYQSWGQGATGFGGAMAQSMPQTGMSAGFGAGAGAASVGQHDAMLALGALAAARQPAAGAGATAASSTEEAIAGLLTMKMR